MINVNIHVIYHFTSLRRTKEEKEKEKEKRWENYLRIKSSTFSRRNRYEVDLGGG